jgi:hypothetical protein
VQLGIDHGVFVADPVGIFLGFGGWACGRAGGRAAGAAVLS